MAKYLAMAGVASRRSAEELISQGRVTINGLVVDTPAINIDPEKDEICFDGGRLRPEKKIYLLLNKPAGYISSVYDPQGRPTVLDLVRDVDERLYPVGRLDYDTEGLLLMSNDGEFTNLMIHPRYEMNKKYEALVAGLMDKDALTRLENGVELEDGPTAPAVARIIRKDKEKTLLEIEIHEGRKRQVRRMCLAVGHPVISLKRIAFAGLTLDGVAPGQYRHLSAGEYNSLINQAIRNQR